MKENSSTFNRSAIFLAQFGAILAAAYEASEKSVDYLTFCAQWAADKGFAGLQLPACSNGFIDVDKCATDLAYAEQVQKDLSEKTGVQIVSLTFHISGQMVMTHPTYDPLWEQFVPEEYQGDRAATIKWAIGRVKTIIRASKNLGLKVAAGFSGGCLWPFFYSWPPRPDGMVEIGFAALIKRWAEILKVAKECGVKLGFELHPSEDTHDGASLELFIKEFIRQGHSDLVPFIGINVDLSHLVLAGVDNWGLIDHINRYRDMIFMHHVKGAQFMPDGRGGAYGGYQPWLASTRRFRTAGRDNTPWQMVFEALNTCPGFDGWHVAEWEDDGEDPESGAEFMSALINGKKLPEGPVKKSEGPSFEGFAGGGKVDKSLILKVLGLEEADLTGIDLSHINL